METLTPSVQKATFHHGKRPSKSQPGHRVVEEHNPSHSDDFDLVRDDPANIAGARCLPADPHLSQDIDLRAAIGTNNEESPTSMVNPTASPRRAAVSGRRSLVAYRDQIGTGNCPP
ncbi:hypothetical protein [Actinomadura rugatobispora]|uniref:Uncharacterized protein n=1 Tax=Actinomadura rugatobispora TaxID=1994 RepID=A0ABW1A4F0_9ACTN|nr:hypothetical protein GCM10010200_042560 [Actinomadura rugatobispora]